MKARRGEEGNKIPGGAHSPGMTRGLRSCSRACVKMKRMIPYKMCPQKYCIIYRNATRRYPF